MSRAILFATITFFVALITVPSTVYSQSADEVAKLFEMLDADRDGVVEPTEVTSTQTPHFERLLRVNDRNQDGRLERSEFETGLKQRPESATPLDAAPTRNRNQFDVAQIFNRLDRNADGKLTRSEIPEQVKERFERLFTITGKDEVTLAELERLRAMRDSRSPSTKTPNEVAPTMMSSNANPRAPIWSTLDRNGDQKLTTIEMELAPARLLALDRNRDGEITADELSP